MPELCTPDFSLLHPVELQGWGVRLVPLEATHAQGLAAAAEEDAQWQFALTWIPAPDDVPRYIAHALAMQQQGLRQPFAVLDATSGRVLGTSSYHDIVPAAARLEIGHTWYARSAQRSHVNTACKFLLMQHAFESLHCAVVGWRTDSLNTRSQQAIERLGARKDGVLRHHAVRHDGSVRDTVMYSMLASEWTYAKTRLLEKLELLTLDVSHLQS